MITKVNLFKAQLFYVTYHFHKYRNHSKVQMYNVYLFIIDYYTVVLAQVGKNAH